MPMDDVNAAPDEQEEPQPAPQPEPQPEPEAPQYDVDAAYDVITRAEGWDPRLTRYQIEEHKRRVQDFEREKKEFERKRASQYEPEDTSDPYMNRIGRLERIIVEERQERLQREEKDKLVSHLDRELKSSYVALSRQAGLTKQQMNERADEFFDQLTDLYPEPEMLQQIGIERASRKAWALMNANGSRQVSRPNVNGRGPTAVRTIPGSPQPYLGTGGPPPQEESNSAEQLPGETDDQYEARLRRIIEGAQLRRLPEGMKVQSRQ